ncbi:TPA: DUF1566 domain-containing protein [Vibrio vulnificus]|uniref:DUF1566 domain-containing protein n=1 Tax=Vibrio vulnificus TaxID=672 RepID=A0A8H9N1Y6_VIBVL|nr:DUF1566 domain-containing protein [Vibrio vulnificus]
MNPIQCSKCSAIAPLKFDKSFYDEFQGMALFEATELGWIHTEGEHIICMGCRKEIHSVWRLPTKTELISVLWENSVTNPEILRSLELREEKGEEIDEEDYFANPVGQELFSKVFNSMERLQFWSSSCANPVINSSAWSMRIDIGRPSIISKRGRTSVRLVRSMQAKPTWKFGDDPELRYTVSDCGDFITDNRTGLQWKRSAEAEKFTWDDAVAKYGTIENITTQLKPPTK